MSFEPIGLSCFKHILDSFTNYSSRTPIRVREFTSRICDFVTFFVSINASGLQVFAHQ